MRRMLLELLKDFPSTPESITIVPVETVIIMVAFKFDSNWVPHFVNKFHNFNKQIIMREAIFQNQFSIAQLISEKFQIAPTVPQVILNLNICRKTSILFNCRNGLKNQNH